MKPVLVAAAASSMLIVLLSAATAQELFSTAAQKELSKYLYPKEGPFEALIEPSKRRGFAKAILNVCEEYRNEVPSLSPDEDSWLKEEMKHNGTRFNAAVNSPVFARFQTSLVFDQCIQQATAITSIEGADIGENWVTLLLTLNDGDIFEVFTRFGVDGNKRSVIGNVNLVTRETANTIVRRVIWPKVKWQ